MEETSDDVADQLIQDRSDAIAESPAAALLLLLMAKRKTITWLDLEDVSLFMDFDMPTVAREAGRLRDQFLCEVRNHGHVVGPNSVFAITPHGRQVASVVRKQRTDASRAVARELALRLVGAKIREHDPKHIQANVVATLGSARPN